MSNRLFQNIAHQTSEVLGKVVGVVDKSSTIIACSDVSRMGESLNLINENLMATSEPFVVGAYTCKSFGGRVCTRSCCFSSHQPMSLRSATPRFWRLQ